ncbi:hypothetical protein PRIPAC_97001 [Pristionchus pacificus]|uniref:Uncharacterized protein n=1 Tax=Pristionchus pacificus TaxID=54126 RepID=A0A2A6B3B7_PRIPA|nr:hypothetical protein PRIPAC_97001 [Pristionchus pacificus]|eukprot:PDM60367.1 hypothetical protein PRIPAC_54192 [Pristionchus pacificus]
MQPQWDRILPTIGIIVSLIVVVYEWSNCSFEALVPKEIVLKRGSFSAVVDPSYQWEHRWDKSIGLPRKPFNVSDGFNHTLILVKSNENDVDINFAYSVNHCVLCHETSYLVYSEIYEDRCASVRSVLRRYIIEGDCVFKKAAANKMLYSIRFVLASIAMSFFTTCCGVSCYWWELKELWDIFYEDQMLRMRAFDMMMDEDERLWLERRAAQEELREAIEDYIWEIKRSQWANSKYLPWDRCLFIVFFILVLFVIAYQYKIESQEGVDGGDTVVTKVDFTEMIKENGTMQAQVEDIVKNIPKLNEPVQTTVNPERIRYKEKRHAYPLGEQFVDIDGLFDFNEYPTIVRIRLFDSPTGLKASKIRYWQHGFDDYFDENGKPAPEYIVRNFLRQMKEKRAKPAAVAESFLEGRDRSADLLRVFIIIVSSCWAAYVCVLLLKGPMNLMKHLDDCLHWISGKEQQPKDEGPESSAEEEEDREEDEEEDEGEEDEDESGMESDEDQMDEQAFVDFVHQKLDFLENGLRTVEAAQNYLRDKVRGEVHRTRAAGFGCITIALVGFSMLSTMVIDDRTRIDGLREALAKLNGRL